VAERATAEVLGVARLRALVVDDSDASRAELARVAAEGGLEVVGEAADGEEALAKALRLEPEVVLVDLEMPRMDGFTFVRMLLANRPTIAIVVSSQSRRPDVFRALELGALEFVAKPDRPDAAPAFREALLDRLRLARALRPLDEQPRP
jgi:two-component system, chemotaxis family, protein-glutamate methylesterase/glutaminase